ncbi:MAG TPA: XdhC/CoxI family protein [Actinocrinis sp.]|uniref:XdhC family protein n=1 Tax=Actinocrinis sp. TaxID=1920516 RepID=UPI002DDD8B67|nr:XdhC/CoxI family protein [Actinocrinis sp.]HEV2348200.1 XdhC/CoxI family protein [Actinocrinis sp.]
MHDLAETLRCWQARGEPYALATIVAATGSSPRGAGPALAVDTGGAAAGSVSGGCIDAEVYELCQEVLRTGESLHRSFDADPADSFAPSLSCGGTIEVAIRRVDPSEEAAGLPEDGGPDERPRMLIFGAVQFADALAAMGRLLGYRVTVCDARPVFATPARIPDADEVIVEWPHRYLASTRVDSSTAVCVLTHDPKFDVPVLLEALRSPAGYVGALGSRRTCADRVQRLRDAGLGDAELSRLRAPIGLDLGGTSPQQVALSICAEIVASAHGGTGRPLRDTAGPMHRRSATQQEPQRGFSESSENTVAEGMLTESTSTEGTQRHLMAGP